MLCLVSAEDTTKWVLGGKGRKHIEARPTVNRGRFGGAFVTFCDTFRVWHSHFHSHLPRFYREDGGCFL
jgi:hypothetical protein